MINDILSDFLTKIRNPNSSKHQIVEIVSTNLTDNVTKILKQEGFIYDFQILESNIQNTIIISLKYLNQNRKPVLNKLKRISKPGIRVYLDQKKICSFSEKTGVSIISTSQGIMTDRQAKKLNLGGEVLCTVS